MTKEERRELCTVLLMILLVCICFFSFLALLDKTYVFWGDETQQVLPYLINLYNQFHNGGLSLYDFSYGMGASITIEFFAFLGSPSLYLYLLVPSEDLIVKAIPFVDTLRYLLIGTAAFFWVRMLCTNHKGRIIIPLICTFSGYLLYWTHYSYFMDFYLYLMLLLVASEYILKHQKPLFFTLVICLSGILSVYYMYMFAWLLVIYLTCRLFMIHGHISLKDYFKEFFYVFKYLLLGAGLSAVFVIPSVYLLSTSNRIGSSVNLFSLINIADFYRWFTSLLSPVVNDYAYNIYSSPYKEPVFTVYAVYSYSFILYVLLLPQLLKMKFREKKPLLITLAAVGVMFLFPLFYFLFNGNTSSRWSFFPFVINMLVMIYICNYIDQLDRKLLRYTCVGVVIVLCTVSFTSLHFNLTTDSNKTVVLMNLAVLPIFLILYTVSLQTKKRYGMLLLTASVAAEGLYCLTLRSFNGTLPLNPETDAYETYYEDTFNHPILDTLPEEGFYRTEIADSSENSYNLPVGNEYNGFTFYSSIYNHESEAYIKDRFSGTWFLGYNHSKFLLKSLWSGRYLIINKEDDYYVPYGYSLIGEDDKEYLYENSLVMPVGYASNQFSSLKKSELLDKSQEDIVMLNSIIVEDSEYVFDTEQQYPCIAEDVINSGFDFSKKDGYLFFDYSSVNPATSIQYEFYKDGKVIEYGEADEYGYTAVPVTKDIDQVYVYARNDNNTNEFIPVNVYWISNDTIDSIFESLHQKDLMVNTVMESDDHITSEITVTQDNAYVATSVPYNSGWSVYVDGIQVDTECVNLAFVGFAVEKGHHDIVLKYVPQGFYAGAGVTVVSLAIVLLICIRKRYKDLRS